MTETPTLAGDPPEPTLRGTLAGSGGASLAYARWEAPEPRGRVVIAHGYGEHGGRYAHTAAWLNGLGWSVSALDHRGFGRSTGVRGDARGIQGPVADLVFFLRQERLHDAGRPAGAAAVQAAGAAAVPAAGVGAVPAAGPGPGAPARPPQVLLGHSYGGLLALLVLLWHPDTLDALVVSSPALVLRPLSWQLRLLQRVALGVIPHRSLDLPGNKALVCSDPDMVRRYEADPYCHRRISAGFVAAMAEGSRELLGFGAELERPILLLEAGSDCLVDPDGAEALWSAVRPDLLERHRLDGFFHEIFHDLARARAEAITAQWLDRLFPVAAPLHLQGSPCPSELP
jgi:alpha-beta hydrolase superfamily lysophospholipase